MRNLWVVVSLLGLLSVGCGEDGTHPGEPVAQVPDGGAQLGIDTGAPAPPTPDAMPAAAADAKVTPSPDTHPPTPDAMPTTDSHPGAAADAQPLKTYPGCAQHTVTSQSCGVLAPDALSYLNMKKDGYICRICFPAGPDGNPDFSKAQQTGCIVGSSGTIVLCVQTCGECSY